MNLDFYKFYLILIFLNLSKFESRFVLLFQQRFQFVTQFKTFRHNLKNLNHLTTSSLKTQIYKKGYIREDENTEEKGVHICGCYLKY